MVHLRRSTKSRNALRSYNKLSPIVDIKTRWSSTFDMLVRFNVLLQDLKRAALDSKEIEDRMKFIDDETKIKVASLISVLAPFAEATKLLSSEEGSLITADLILMYCYGKIRSRALQEKFFERVLVRRNYWSDILLYLCGESDGIIFYKKPLPSQIIDLYNKVRQLI